MPAAAAWAPDGPPSAGPSPCDCWRAWSAALDPPSPPELPRRAPTATAPDSAACMNPPAPDPSVTWPVVQVKNRMRTGRASRDMATIAKPVKMVVRFLPVPIIMNATA